MIRILLGIALAAYTVLVATISISAPEKIKNPIASITVHFIFFGIPGAFLVLWGRKARKRTNVEATRAATTLTSKQPPPLPVTAIAQPLAEQPAHAKSIPVLTALPVIEEARPRAGETICKVCGKPNANYKVFRCRKCGGAVCNACRIKNISYALRSRCPLCMQTKALNLTVDVSRQLSCPTCGREWALRIDGYGFSWMGAALKLSQKHRRLCPRCSHSECYVEGCDEQAVTAWSTGIRVGRGKESAVVRDDALVCQRHYDLLSKAYSRAALARHLGSFSGFIGSIAAIFFLVAIFGGSRFALLVLGAVAGGGLLSCYLANLEETRIRKHVLGRRLPRRKSKYAYRAEEEWRGI